MMLWFWLWAPMRRGRLRLEAGEAVNALDFLAEFKATDGHADLGEQVVVIGGGNTAMDTARAAKRNAGVKKVSLVYRRTRRYMPADEEELLMALEDGVEFAELLAPISLSEGRLLCRRMALGAADAGGRRGVVETEETVELPADTVIAAVGERTPGGFYRKQGIAVDEKGRPLVNEETLESSINGVYIAGDGLYGPATVVEGIRDGLKAAQAIAGRVLTADAPAAGDEAVIYERKGRLAEEDFSETDSSRCLGCSSICENCAEVCPNRANVSIRVPGLAMHQILHVDAMCNECGNCRSFCPWDSAPYLHKFTLFAGEKEMGESENQGFAVLDREAGLCRVRLGGRSLDYRKGERPAEIPQAVAALMDAVMEDYAYML